jgi:thiol-disulfide isomerase/thioredoxin
MKRNIFLLIGFIFSLSIFSQERKNLNVKDIQNKYQKTLKLITIYNEKYYADFTGDTSSIQNDQYNFHFPKYDDSIPRPFRFLFETEKNNVYEVSDIFYISKDTDGINFNSDNQKIVLGHNSDKDVTIYDTYMKSYLSEKKKLDSVKFNIYKSKNFKVDKVTVDSIQTFYTALDKDEDSLLMGLSKKNPKSYIVFWRLVGKFEANGFKKKYLQAFDNLDSSVRTSSVGLIFSEELKKGSKIVEGNPFPEFILKGQKVQTSLGKSYTIIDFWFSHCGPCIEQMPKYREIYSKYKDKGFEIINISTDRTKDIGNWKKIIKEKELNWVHYLDENGEKSKYYNINTFPTNFLLDSEGKIIQKDISLQELDIFLNEHLK